MWRANENLNIGCLEDNDCSLLDCNQATDELNVSDSLETSLYENAATESAVCADVSMQYRSLTNNLTSKDSGCHTSESLSNRDEDFALSETFNDEMIDFCITERSTLQLETPMDFNSLLNGSMKNQSVIPKKELKSSSETPTSSDNKKLKRTLPSSDNQSPQKQMRIIKSVSEECVNMSDSERIKLALQRSSTEPDLTGDFSKMHYLPLIPGRHQDLKSITATTVATLIKGEFTEDIVFKIVDCRYPYEYEGGHINGALNLYTKDLLIKTLLNKSSLDDTKTDKRYILIFHCEFSSSRGPTMYRFLRKFDRNCNENVYPTLFFPEMYLLEGGYKEFFSHHPDLCLPKGYVQMNLPEFYESMVHFREETKSGEQYNRKNIKRLNF